MFKFLKSRAFLLLIAFGLIALFIWFAGPFFYFGTLQPLGSERSRLVLIGLVFLAWLGSVLSRWWRARRASAALAAAVVRQPEPERVSPDVAKLRERFEDAVGTLTAGAKGGRTLYDLPWYAFIGAPGSGKTTTLVNSGLKFPLEQRVGKAAVRGVGGTRNCDWWFTEEAVFLDTAGRYTTQDSDAASDSEGWREFLALLANYRKRRPLNGIVLTISAHDLMTQGESGLEAHVDAVHRRLHEFVRELQIQLPVYVMVTKCDTVAGFVDYFDDLTQDGRAQVWGVTFPYDDSVRGAAAGAFPGEFDALLERLNGRLFSRIEEVRGGRRRGGVFAFPQQMAALRDPLARFLDDVFGTRQLEGQVLLRGVYFTSGTQDGTQIDRLMGAMGRRLGVAPEVTASQAGRGKAYFVERLLREVVIAESGLAGTNRKLERRNALWQFGAYAAMAFVVVVGVLGLSASYARNRTYLGQVAAEVEALKRLPPVTVGAPVETLLPRLNAVAAVAEVAERYRPSVPFMMRWGLYQGSSLGNAARDAYGRELDSLLLPQFASRIERHVREYAADPDRLYVYLKGYLMLGQPQHLDKDHLRFLAGLEWPSPAGSSVPSVTGHLDRLLDARDGLRPIALDASLVSLAQATLNRASIAQIMYGWLQREREDAPLRFDMVAGLGIEQVMRRKSGKRIAEPFPGLYTKPVFREATTTGMVALAKQFSEESWVWGSTRTLSQANIVQLTTQLTELYERDYARAWNDLLRDLEFVPFTSIQTYRDALSVIVGPTSPVRGLLRTVVEHTTLIDPPSGAPAGATPGLVGRATKGMQELFKKGAEAITGAPAIAPGARVTAEFAPIHKVNAGTPSPVEAVLEQVRKLRDQLERIGPQTGGSDPVKSLSDATVIELWNALARDARTLPAPLDEWFRQIAQESATRVAVEAGQSIEQRYQTLVVGECKTRLTGRYPFVANAAGEMAVTDFGELFGAGGVYDKFFTENLQALVDTSQRPWQWRPNAAPLSGDLLSQFERADQLKQMFFRAGGKTPKVEFTVEASDLDESADGFYMAIDDVSLRIKPKMSLPQSFAWTGKGGLRLTFEDRVAPPVDVFRRSDPWALFRLIDQVGGQRETDLVTALSIQSPHHRARLRIVAPNAAANPFGRREWREFACES